MDALSTTLFWLDYAAVAVFGATGALAAAHRKHDIITFGFFAAITGVGGGTLRDLLIDAPVFWVARPQYVAVCLAAALGVSILLRRELYVTPALMGAALFVGLDAVGISTVAAGVAGFFAALIVRGGAIL